MEDDLRCEHCTNPATMWTGSCPECDVPVCDTHSDHCFNTCTCHDESEESDSDDSGPGS